MHLVDLVRYGSAAAGKPQVGMLYAQLVHDYLRGQSLSATDYASFVGVVPRQVQRYLKDLSDWGLITLKGRTRSRQVLLEAMPNLQFCEAVISGLYGSEALEDVRKGNRAAELCSTTGPSDPVANYAVQVLLGLYANRPFVTYSYSQPTATSGTGAVKLATYSDISFGHPIIYILKEVVVVDKYIQILTTTTERMSECLDVAKVATYPTELPAGILVQERTTSPQQRAAKANKRDTLPNSSWAFSTPGWTLDKIQAVDLEYWQPVHDVLAHWNERLGHEEKMDKFRYATIRSALVEESIPMDTVRRAVTAASIDTWYKSRAELKSFFREPQRIRNYAKRSTHDRLGRTMDVHPKGEVVGYEF